MTGSIRTTDKDRAHAQYCAGLINAHWRALGVDAGARVTDKGEIVSDLPPGASRTLAPDAAAKPKTRSPNDRAFAKAAPAQSRRDQTQGGKPDNARLAKEIATAATAVLNAGTTR